MNKGRSVMSTIRNAEKMWFIVIALSAATLVTCAPCIAKADFLPVYGGLTYAQSAGGYVAQTVLNPSSYALDLIHTPGQVNNTGTAVGYALKYDGSFNYLGERAPLGRFGAATELGHLGTANGYTVSVANAINDAGMAVGITYKHDISGSYKGPRAVRWEASGTAATELENLGTSPSGFTSSFAHAVNSVGTAVGTAQKYDSSGNFLGDPAVRWDASGTVTELQTFVAPGAEPYTRDRAYSINDAGTAVGSSKYFYSGGCEDCGYQGFLPVRWDASGTAVTVLGGQTAVDGEAYAINDTGTAVGYVNTLELDGSGYLLESRAIRWDASATATMLGILPSLANFKAFAINDAGIAVGSAKKHDGSGNDLGVRAVRWDATGMATELGNLGTDLNGYTDNYASAINAGGTTVGSVIVFDGSGYHAVYWGADGAAIDLNTLIDPSSGWRLKHAQDISDTGWIEGVGVFDPDGSGAHVAYSRHFLIHVPAAAVPEPATLALFVLALPLLTVWRPRSQRTRSR